MDLTSLHCTFLLVRLYMCLLSDCYLILNADVTQIAANGTVTLAQLNAVRLNKLLNISIRQLIVRNCLVQVNKDT